MDPLSHEVSHLVVSMNGAGERQVPMGAVQTVTERSGTATVILVRNPAHCLPSSVTTMSRLHEVEIPDLEETYSRHAGRSPGPVP